MNIRDLAKQFYVVFPAEWFANRMAKDCGAAAPSIFCVTKPNPKATISARLICASTMRKPISGRDGVPMYDLRQ